MIRKLVTGLHLPVEVALRETKAPPVRRTASRAGHRRLQATAARTGNSWRKSFPRYPPDTRPARPVFGFVY